MKRLLLALLLAFAPLAPLALSTGCANTSAKAVAYKSLKTTWLSVDASMQVAAELNRVGKLSERDKQDIIDAHNKYRQAFDTAITAAQLDWNTATPASVSALAADVITLIAVLAQ